MACLVIVQTDPDDRRPVPHQLQHDIEHTIGVLGGPCAIEAGDPTDPDAMASSGPLTELDGHLPDLMLRAEPVLMVRGMERRLDPGAAIGRRVLDNLVDKSPQVLRCLQHRTCGHVGVPKARKEPNPRISGTSMPSASHNDRNVEGRIEPSRCRCRWALGSCDRSRRESAINGVFHATHPPVG